MPKRACYFQGCGAEASTKEHIPPRAFFPSDQRNQLLTVPSCPEHNNDKSADDLYVLAHICLHASPNNRSREVFVERVLPQLGFNEDAFRKILTNQAVRLPDSAVKYKVDARRLDRFFDSLTFGVLFKSAKAPLPPNYTTRHIYHNLEDEGSTPEEREMQQHIERFYSGPAPTVLDFGRVKTMNESVYSAGIYGVSGYRSSITLVHRFFGVFRVTSMVTYRPFA